jgi:phage recombination protein Bet
MSDFAVIPSPAPPKLSLVARIADRYGVEPTKMLDTLKATAFKTDKPISNEQMMALLVVAEQYKLNPFTKELYAFPDKRGGIVPVVSIDGWARIINEHPMYDGMEVGFNPDHQFAECTMYRKDRSHPTVITEYMAECKRSAEPWQTHPRRMLRHKAVIQCARMAFGFAGIYDEDEAQRITQMGPADEVVPSTATQRIQQALSAPPPVYDAVTEGPVIRTPKPVVADEAVETGPGLSLAEYRARMASCDADVGVILLDEARSALDPADHTELVKLYHSTFTKEA